MNMHDFTLADSQSTHTHTHRDLANLLKQQGLPALFQSIKYFLGLGCRCLGNISNACTKRYRLNSLGDNARKGNTVTLHLLHWISWITLKRSRAEGERHSVEPGRRAVEGGGGGSGGGAGRKMFPKQTDCR